MLLDIIFLIVLIIFLIYGYFKGFIKFAVDFFGTLGALAASIFLCRPIGFWAFNITGLSDVMNNSFAEWLGNLGEAATREISVADAGSIASLLNELKFPGFLSEAIAPILADHLPLEGTTTIANLIAPFISAVVIIFVSFILLFIAFKLIVSGLLLLIKGMLKAKPIKFVDRFIGAIFSGCLFVLVTFVFFAVFSLFEGFEFMRPVNDYLADASFLSYLKSINPVKNWLDSFDFAAFISDIMSELGI